MSGNVDWDPSLRRSAGSSLASILRAHAERALSTARALAPQGSGPGVRFRVYEKGLAAAKSEVRFQDMFADLDAFLERLDAGDAGAIEMGLAVAHRLDAEAAVPVAEALLAEPPWNGLGSALARALGASASARAFELLVAHARAPYVCGGLATVRFAGGVERARAELVALGDLSRLDLPPRDRVVAESLLLYLVRFDREPTVRLLAALFDSSSPLAPFAGRALLGEGDGPGLAILAASLDTPSPQRHTLDFAVRALLHTDPSTTVDALGGEAFLSTAEGAARASTLLKVLFRDAADGKAGRRTEGWARRDPRFRDVAEPHRKDRELKDIVAALFPPERPAPKRAAPRRAAPEPKAAWIASMRDVRASLERLVAHLRGEGYRFAAGRHALRAPTGKTLRAIAAIERAAGPVPAALRAFWAIVGAVDLRGEDPRWPRRAVVGRSVPSVEADLWLTDPLVVAGAEAVSLELEDVVRDAPNALSIAPDRLGKAGYSAGELRVWLPAKDDDPILEGGEVDGERFTGYVARALGWAGFPGFGAIAERPEAWLAAARAAAAAPRD